MNTRDDPPTTRTCATAFEAPTLVSIGDAQSVVLGLPWGGDDHFGYSPPRFEFEEDDDGAAPRPPKRFPEGRVPRQTEWASRHTGFPR